MDRWTHVWRQKCVVYYWLKNWVWNLQFTFLFLGVNSFLDRISHKIAFNNFKKMFWKQITSELSSPLLIMNHESSNPFRQCPVVLILFICLDTILARAGEPANFLAAPASDFFSKRLRLLTFSKRLRLLVFFQAAPAPRSQKRPAPASPALILAVFILFYLFDMILWYQNVVFILFIFV